MKICIVEKNMLKNWTIITEATRDVIAREHYLMNASHRNHRQTENIINIHGSEKQSLNILRNCERYKLKQAAKRKGGRPPTQSVEFVCTLPKGVRPDENQWRQILKILMVNLASHLNLSTNQLPSIVRAVAHQQKQDMSVKGSGDHIHIIVGKFTDDLTYLAELQRKSTTRLFKSAFNTAVLEAVGVDNRAYKPRKPYSGEARKRVPTWQVKSARKQEDLKLQEKHLHKMINQANKWLHAYEVGDTKQMNRQYNRLIKGMDAIDASNEETASLYDFMQNLVCKVEMKAQKGGRLTSRMQQLSV
ncbi:Relaxase/mobilization nuclease-like protein [Vibrio crassostreae]|nr:Relaxase/mobilization nuclease-like protein [Vibrio crassostreae]CAK2466282.1 Relaxase/mobilization nuclease-like protein [Vibrio crassostreae]CAK3748297.1 Relaxase/mobilization nuclease-like protein [Vibrio crassostreae]CAK3871525.1 Relaxase/mobilization nuclease-like protein [Vibrio crassostreae]